MSKKDEICNKYYSTYGKRKLTGGIMVCWCTHSISQGFHCIPAAEGRNDVFSAMYTHWTKAPKCVVYDFACSLGPYCMTREPLFFADTIFAIDGFHQRDHSKCTPANFLSTYTRTDPSLSTVNSSAAECGNHILNRIRRPLHYMGQRRSVLYLKVSCFMRLPSCSLSLIGFYLGHESRANLEDARRFQDV